MRISRLLASACAASLLAACAGGQPAPTAGDAAAGGADKEVVVLTHNSFELPAELITKFEQSSGYRLQLVPSGDGGELVNKLALTKDAPLGDAVYGVDNTFASRALQEGVVAPVELELPAGVADYQVAGRSELTPIDMGDVCVNADKAWFDAQGLAVPQTFADLTKPEYRGLLVALNPATSSPGLAFMLATVGHFGEEKFTDFWRQLADGGLRVSDGWSEAFGADFSAGEGKGKYPLMVSYASSPSYFVNDDATATTVVNLPDTCFRQVEYAGVLTGAKEPEGAKAFLEFLLSKEVQEVLPDVIYMYPVRQDAALPEKLAKFGPLSPHPITVDPEQIDAHRADWITKWNEAVAK
ncbi:thiamine ABC transporter substrate-binding protein [Buchananella hordeovulneris]|uniref:thiamine ABC transporter substrate-binding protein n=1 Tax=Buchananella hordeovulneris TaxID=52770 RepID=UPI000F5F8B19|nr:thiamine ABC transporter substrate-binding protein [Buchananella hordeovulneris]RRD51646.1 thiamine ABC transporter substrate-binding protein [Buchananella hordeovulneris]